MEILPNFQHTEPSALELAELDRELPMLHAELEELLAEVAVLDHPSRLTLVRWLKARRLVHTTGQSRFVETATAQGYADWVVA
ncbi:MAG: hypothetical protein H0T78_11625 [Longispora sp.]|nr:hypothetical protein [Longispora sp. (in: high G+C Gram-positive bacteria)]